MRWGRLRRAKAAGKGTDVSDEVDGRGSDEAEVGTRRER